MSSTQERFQAAVNVIKGLPKNGPYQPSTSMMLKFYGLYKQATEGACHNKRPSFWDVVNRAKWDAWNRNSHLSREEAMEKYVENLQEIIETMSFTENVQNFVGSLQGLENINLDELEIIAPRMRELAESHPNSPFHSRAKSPQRNNININGKEHLSNGDISSSEEIETNSPPLTPAYQLETVRATSTNSITPETIQLNYSQNNGPIDQSDDEYVDPFDIQNELYDSMQRNTEIIKQVQTTVLRMNHDLSAVNQRILDLEKTIKELKNIVLKPTPDVQQKSRYPKWWPLLGISPGWFVLLILWPFFIRSVRKLIANTPKRK